MKGGRKENSSEPSQKRRFHRHNLTVAWQTLPAPSPTLPDREASTGRTGIRHMNLAALAGYTQVPHSAHATDPFAMLRSQYIRILIAE
jgi:hypothetical protein